MLRTFLSILFLRFMSFCRFDRLPMGWFPDMLTPSLMSQRLDRIEVGGTTAGAEYDQLAVGGTATLDGTIDVVLIDDFQPQPGDVFDVLLADSIVDLGVDFSLPDLPGSLQKTQIVAAEGVQVLRLTVAVPEPWPFGLLATAILLLPLLPGKERSTAFNRHGERVSKLTWAK